MEKICTITLEDNTQAEVLVKYELITPERIDYGMSYEVPYYIDDEENTFYHVVSISSGFKHIQELINNDFESFETEIIEQL